MLNHWAIQANQSSSLNELQDLPPWYMVRSPSLWRLVAVHAQFIITSSFIHLNLSPYLWKQLMITLSLKHLTGLLQNLTFNFTEKNQSHLMSAPWLLFPPFLSSAKHVHPTFLLSTWQVYPSSFSSAGPPSQVQLILAAYISWDLSPSKNFSDVSVHSLHQFSYKYS